MQRKMDKYKPPNRHTKTHEKKHIYLHVISKNNDFQLEQTQINATQTHNLTWITDQIQAETEMNNRAFL